MNLLSRTFDMSDNLEKKPEHHHVVVLGASPKPERYSNQAVCLLLENGYRVTPVHPKLEQIEGLQVAPTLSDIEQPVDTLSLYVGPERLSPMIGEILALKPGRVICNPGTESKELQQKLDAAGIPWLEACTLVMLRLGNF
jgi:predicted CoA-binding protein